MTRIPFLILLAVTVGFPASRMATLAPATGSTFEVKGGQKQALLRFDLTKLPSGVTITRARLALTLGAVASELPAFSKRFSVSIDEGREDTLLVKGDGGYLIEIPRKALRGKPSISICIAGMEANPRASVVKAALDIESSPTAPRADAGGFVLEGAGSISLNGSRSALPDGTTAGLRHAWTIDKPAFGSANLAGERIGEGALASFSPRTPGFYLVKLRVTNPATGESDEDTTGVHTALRPHPRLQVDQEVLARIRKLRDTSDPLWSRFYQRLQSAPKGAGQAAQANLLISSLLAYLVTGEERFFDAAWRIGAARLYKNGKDRTGGVVRLIDAYDGDRHRAAFQGGQFISQMAILFDWGVRPPYHGST